MNTKITLTIFALLLAGAVPFALAWATTPADQPTTDAPCCTCCGDDCQCVDCQCSPDCGCGEGEACACEDFCCKENAACCTCCGDDCKCVDCKCEAKRCADGEGGKCPVAQPKTGCPMGACGLK